ncbi:Palmitoyltransferase PFA3 [Dictyocoela muelleri]|nr:Palmitoyltransferase PFA3 [Dictyocoela muelleri]
MENIMKLLIKKFAIIIYPLSAIYIYFVFTGIFCIYQERLIHSFDCLTFILFHVLMTYIMIFYIKIMSSSEKSTSVIFPKVKDVAQKLDLSDINPFFGKEIINKSYKNLRICPFCNTYKPPRCQHCEESKKCYLKIDHYSYIFGRCIDFYNYKTYLQFIIMVCITSLGIVCLLIYSYKKGTRGFIEFYVSGIIILIIQFIILLRLSIFNINLVLRNETLIEYQALNLMEKGDFSLNYVFLEGHATGIVDLNKLARSYLNPYCLSKMQNSEQVFGVDRISWLLPNDSSIGDGVTFPKNFKEENYDII